MYLKKSTNRKTGRTYLSIVHGYRDKKTGTSKTRTIKSIGYLDELEKEYDDPIAHFTKIANDMNQEYIEKNKPLSFDFDPQETIDPSSTNRKNLGYAAFSRIYHELKIDKFFKNRQRRLNIDFNLNHVVKLLTMSRLLSPASKKKTFESKDSYFEKNDFSLDDVYRSLTYISKYRNVLLAWLHKEITKQYNRNTDLAYYDVTNYYFEIDKPDSLRKKGVSKEHRPNPIVQMGLLTDTEGLPISYKLFSGNLPDCTTLIPSLASIQSEYGLGRVIVVADKGINTSNNVCYNLLKGNGYVYSQSIRGGSKELKNYVLNENGYRYKGDNFKIKSRLYPREVTLINDKGKKNKVTIDEKQVIFYSKEHDKKAKADRAPALKKAYELVNNPAKFTQTTAHGAAKYIRNLHFDKKTGEILTTGHKPTINLKKLKEEERYDGYYAIVTSEYKKSDEEIIDIYRGLWKIEETFRVTKSDLSSRPVYVSREDHIQAHFLTCFLALLIIRILQKRTKNKYSPAKLIESLNNVQGTHLKDNYYLFDYNNRIINDIGDATNIDFSKRIMSLGEIKKILAGTKKV